MKAGKFFGCTMILIGTTIGAAMLALPLVSAGAGFTWNAILMVITWMIAIITGLLVVEVTLALPSHSCSFNSMAKHTMGNFGKIITWIIYLFLLYAILTAYVIGGSNMIGATIGNVFQIEIPTWTNAILFTAILGIAVFWSTQAVDYFNRNLMGFKGLFLIAALVLAAPHIEVKKLIASQNISQINYLWGALPIFLCAFCYQFVIPSLRIYVGDEPKQLRTMIIISTTVSLLVYLWWIAAALGTIPLAGDGSFVSIAHDPKPPSELIQLIIRFANNPWLTASLNGFSNIALTTSFLGVALGLFDFLAEGFKRPNTRFGRLQTAGLTFAPPLLVALFYPAGFVKAITYASIACISLTIILPAVMAYQLRKNTTMSSSYRVKCGNLVLAAIILTGIISIIFAIMYILNLLPTLS